MKKTFSCIILPLLFFIFLGCAGHPLQIPQKPVSDPSKEKTHIQQFPQNLTKKRQTIVNHAIENLGKPYSWGGKSPDLGFDCSGLVLYAYGKANLWVPRTSRDQFKKGHPISKSALQPGDLVFFTPEKKICIVR